MKYEELPIETKKFMQDAVEAIKKNFPHSDITARFTDSFGYAVIYIGFMLSKDTSECSNGIRGNDAVSTYFKVETNTDGTLKGDKTVLELSNGGFVCRIADPTIPNEKYCVYGRVKLPFRKTTGTSEKLVSALSKWASKAAVIMLENAEAINAGTIKGLFKVEDKVVI